MVNFNNPEAINMIVPDYTIDNIIGITSGSFSIDAPTKSNPVFASDLFSTGFDDTCLFQGVFSTNGGSTWNDFGVNIPNLSTPREPVLQTVTCQGWVTPSGVFTAYATNYYDLVHSIGTSYTIDYKVALIAKDDQGAITPIATDEILQYSSGYNFQKVFISDSFSNTTGNTPITHNLGYVPKVRAWFTASEYTESPSGSTPFTSGSMLSYDWAGISNYNIEVSTSTANFDGISSVFGSGTTYYRIYWNS